MQKKKFVGSVSLTVAEMVDVPKTVELLKKYVTFLFFFFFFFASVPFFLKDYLSFCFLFKIFRSFVCKIFTH